MSRKSIFTVVGGAALGLLIAAGILWVEPLAAESEYVEEQEPVSPLVAEVIRQETPQEAAYSGYECQECPLRGQGMWNGRCENTDCEYDWHPLDEEDDNEQ